MRCRRMGCGEEILEDVWADAHGMGYVDSVIDCHMRIKYGVWTQRNGIDINIEDMTNRHIMNCISMLQPKENSSKSARLWIKRFKQELKARGNKDES